MPINAAEWTEGEYEVPVCKEDIALKGYYCSNCTAFVLSRRMVCPGCGLPMLAWEDEHFGKDGK